MTKVLVSGLTNIETTIQIEEFPVEYTPVEYPFFSIDATVSGVGYNVTKALTRLGDRVSFLSILGQDLAVPSVRDELQANFIDGSHVYEIAALTSRSVIMFDKQGRRKIFVDLKDNQEQVYPLDTVERLMPACDIAVLCNVNYSRPMLDIALKAGKPIATDVHTVAELDDDYNADFMQAASILFMSGELLPVSPEEWAKEVIAKFNPEILIIGLGKEGALLAVPKDEFVGRIPAVEVRPVVSSVGAGDALFAAFLHSYMIDKDPYESIKKATLFAAYKVGVRASSEGFPGRSKLDSLYQEWEDNLEGLLTKSG